MKKICKGQASQKEFRIEKGLKKYSDRLYAKWNGYDNLFNG